MTMSTAEVLLSSLIVPRILYKKSKHCFSNTHPVWCLVCNVAKKIGPSSFYLTPAGPFFCF